MSCVKARPSSTLWCRPHSIKAPNTGSYRAWPMCSPAHTTPWTRPQVLSGVARLTSKSRAGPVLLQAGPITLNRLGSPPRRKAAARFQRHHHTSRCRHGTARHAIFSPGAGLAAKKPPATLHAELATRQNARQIATRLGGNAGKWRPASGANACNAPNTLAHHKKREAHPRRWNFDKSQVAFAGRNRRSRHNNRCTTAF